MLIIIFLWIVVGKISCCGMVSCESGFGKKILVFGFVFSILFNFCLYCVVKVFSGWVLWLGIVIVSDCFIKWLFFGGNG